MMRFFYLLLLSVCCTASVFSQNTNKVVFSFEHKVGNTPLAVEGTVFPIWNNKKVKLNRAAFYLSEISLREGDNTTVDLENRYLLVDAAKPNAEFDLGNWPVSSINGINMYIGVSKLVNHNDPAAWPANHPLAPQNPSMHWGWASGYRFMAIEGLVDNNNDGTPEATFEYHNVGDELYTALEVKGSAIASNGVLHVHLVLDYAKLFQNMALSGSLIQHGDAAPNVIMMQNAGAANFITLPASVSASDIQANAASIKAMPNPVAGATVLEYSLAQAASTDIWLTNALGQRVRQWNGLTHEGALRLDLSDLPNGVYQCVFYQGGKAVGRKALIVRGE